MMCTNTSTQSIMIFFPLTSNREFIHSQFVCNLMAGAGTAAYSAIRGWQRSPCMEWVAACVKCGCVRCARVCVYELTIRWCFFNDIALFWRRATRILRIHTYRIDGAWTHSECLFASSKYSASCAICTRDLCAVFPVSLYVRLVNLMTECCHKKSFGWPVYISYICGAFSVRIIRAQTELLYSSSFSSALKTNFQH